MNYYEDYKKCAEFGLEWHEEDDDNYNKAEDIQRGGCVPGLVDRPSCKGTVTPSGNSQCSSALSSTMKANVVHNEQSLAFRGNGITRPMSK